MSKYGQDIRRIARYKDLKDTNTTDNKKTDIPGKRGVAIEQSGNITSFSSSPGSTGTQKRVEEVIADLLASGASDELKKALQQALGLDETDDSQGNSPEQENKPIAAGASSIADIIDGNSDLIESLTEITGLEDIATGDTFSVNMQGQYPAPAATSIAENRPNPTSDWSSSVDPPLALDYVSGAWLAITHSGGTLGTYYSFRYGDAIQWDIDNTDVWASFFDWNSKSGGSGSAPNYPNDTDLALISGTNSTVTYTARILRNTDSPGTPTGAASVIMSACNRPLALPSEASALCAASPPTETSWPRDFTSTLALEADGLIKSSTYDASDIGQAYREGVAILVADFASGTRRAVLEPGRDNTTLVYEIDSNNDPTGKVRIYSRGKISRIFGGGLISERATTLKSVDSVTNINNYRLPNQINRIIRTTGVVKGRIYRK